MQIHDKGAKADRDRAILVASYTQMCKEFRTPVSKRLTPVDISKMTNTQLFQASKDLYNSQPLHKAVKLSNKLNMRPKQESWIIRFFKSFTQTPTKLDESHSKVRYEAQSGQA